MQRPSKLFPSATADVNGGGVIDAIVPNTFTAVLDGTKPINAYQLICRKNSIDNAIVYNTGINVLAQPFYGVDAFGNIVPFNVTVPASAAHLAVESASADGNIVTLTTNVPAKLVGSRSSILLSTDNGATWTGTSSNPITGITFSGTLISITFTSPHTGKTNKIKIPTGVIAPVDSHYSSPTADIITGSFYGYIPDALQALHLSSAYVAAGTAFTATVEGMRDGYTLNRSGVVSVKSGNTEYASRVSDASKISYSIFNDVIYLFVGLSVPTGTYTVKYTDPSLTDSPNSVQGNLVVAANGAISYTKITSDSDRVVLTMHMNQSIALGTNFASKVQTSTNGGTTWVATNPVVGAAVSNIEASYTQQASYTVSIEFANPIANGTLIRFSADAFTHETSVSSAQFITHPFYYVDEVLVNSASIEDTWIAVPNNMVNGGKYKWTLRVWATYDSEHKSNNMLESYEACFDAYDSPVLSITGDDSVTQRTATWEGSYTQTQGVPLMWHEWQIFADGTLVETSGRIYSAVSPSFSYNGLLADTTYTITLTTMNQVGVTSTATFTTDVSYTELGVEGSVTIRNRQDGSVEVNVKQAEYIVGQATGPYEFQHIPVADHTSVSTGASTTISFSSTSDFGVDWTADDYLVYRLHGSGNGVLLSYTSDDGTFACSFEHRGMVGGLAPSNELYPGASVYPSRGAYGEFVYKVNGVEVATYSTDGYGYKWYTVVLTHNSMTVYSHDI